MPHSDKVQLLKTLASETRIGIVELLLSRPDGLRFSDIAKSLKTYPSTLEDHLRRLVEAQIIVHVGDRYLANMNTEVASWIVNSLAPIRDEEFFATHRLTLGDPKLRADIQSLDYEIYRDLISILSKVKEILSPGIKTCFLGGDVDMRLEQGFFDLWSPTFKDTNVEAVLTQKGAEDFMHLDHPDRLMEAMDPSRIRFYVVDECDFAVGGCERGGFLFLPLHDTRVDFNSCLCFESPAGTEWLRNVFESLRARSVEIRMEELLK